MEFDLQKLAEMGIIDAGRAREIESMALKSNVKKMLDKYQVRTWYYEKRNYWAGHVPDRSCSSGRRLIHRKSKEDLELAIYEAYLKWEKGEDIQTNSSVCANEPAESGRTTKELFEEFLEYKKNSVALSTIKRMQADWRRFVSGTEFETMAFASVKKPDVDILFNSAVRRFDIKERAFENFCGTIKQTFQYAVDKDYIAVSPYRVRINRKELVPTRKKGNNLEIFFPDEERSLRAVLSEWGKGFTLPLALLLDFELGLRKGELLGLKFSDFDLKENVVSIERQVVEDLNDNLDCVGWKVVDHTKSFNSLREIPLTQRAKHILDLVCDENKQMGSNSDFLFTRDGELYSGDALDYWLRKACKRAGIPNKTSHKIRKTFASKLYVAGVPIPVISKVLGHADESTTMKHYVFGLSKDHEMHQSILDALKDDGANIAYPGDCS